MTGRFVHTGQIVADLVMRVDALPPLGGDVLASSFEQHVGGGFNVMAAAARSGADVVYAGSHGSGQFDDLARKALAEEGIILALPPDDNAIGVCFVIVDQTGERTFITSPGAEGRVRPVDVDGDIVYITGYSLTHTINRDALLAWLPSISATVMLDPSPLAASIPAETWRAVLPYVDILSSNAAEAAALSDVDVPIRVRRDGPRGCTIVYNSQTTQVPGFDVYAVDTNGAGDIHCGVLAAELLRGNNILYAAQRANAAAALSVTRHGPATAPTRAEIDKLVH
ncbi:PfkB family carbohydrate kinase [Actinocrispum wychmicini]|uniref:Sugar/nucleoside kinase (Ribokinase family) n=1 Tax=Actinocrispum wychmicini TaxID=1213861 RepID=A0A4R2J7N8_9PSEU|nr:PfkB family carbohydrate kinase [Actinocrispum wychmicini]TCO55163.1 sugar/nucleoside kinase (ribokinase family) [Actinocrispum wychmicini]